MIWSASLVGHLPLPSEIKKKKSVSSLIALLLYAVKIVQAIFLRPSTHSDS